MTKPILNSFCLCQSLRFGSILTGILGIILAIATIIIIYTVKLQIKTIVLDYLDSDTVRIILTLNLCMTVLISVLLIIGVAKRNHFIMLPWVILGLMLIIGLLFSAIYTAVVAFIDGETISGIVWMVAGPIFVALGVYFWCVVYSYYAVLYEENSRGLYDKQPYRR